MSVLLDTNVVLRLAAPDVREAVDGLRDAGHRLCVAPQSCVEAYVVATRPAGANGLGLTPADGGALLDAIAEAFDVPADPPDLLARWRRVVAGADVRGVRAHDARLAAFAEAHGLRLVVTHDVGDFAPFAGACGLRVVHPADAPGLARSGG